MSYPYQCSGLLLKKESDVMPDAWCLICRKRCGAGSNLVNGLIIVFGSLVLGTTAIFLIGWVT